MQMVCAINLQFLQFLAGLRFLPFLFILLFQEELFFEEFNHVAGNIFAGSPFNSLQSRG